MMCVPRGVQSLSHCSPAPFFAVETAYSLTRPPVSSNNCRHCLGRLISIRGISDLRPLRGKELAQQRGAFLCHDACGEAGMVIEPRFGEQADHTAAGAGLGIGGAVD